MESFSKTYNAALLNCSAFISRLDVVSKFDDTAKSFFALHDKLLPGYSGLQILLAKGLFHYDINTQERAFDLLLQSWGALPVNLVDPNPTNLFYTTIYSIVWLFSLILEGGAAKEELVKKW